jgi:hypothetical protein
MDVLDTCHDLVKEAGGLEILNTLVLHDVIEQLSPVGELHHQEQLFRGLDDLA